MSPKRLDFARQRIGALRLRLDLAAAAGAVDGLTQTIEADGLQQIIGCVHIERVGGILFMGGDEDDLGALVLGHLAGGAQAAAAGHLDIEDHQIGGKLFDRGERAVAVAGLPHDFDAVDVREQRAKPVQRKLFVINQENTHLVSTPPESPPALVANGSESQAIRIATSRPYLAVACRCRPCRAAEARSRAA